MTRNHQVTVPKDVRVQLGFKAGDRLLFTVHEDHLHVSNLDDDVFERCYGLWGDIGETGLEYERRLRAEWDVRWKREYDE